MVGKREQEGPIQLRRDPLGRIPWLKWEMACGSLKNYTAANLSKFNKDFIIYFVVLWYYIIE